MFLVKKLVKDFHFLPMTKFYPYFDQILSRKNSFYATKTINLQSF